MGRFEFAMGRFGCMMGRFGQCNGPFWTIFLEIKILGAVLVRAVLAMGRFGIDPFLLYDRFKFHQPYVVAQGGYVIVRPDINCCTRGGAVLGENVLTTGPPSFTFINT